MPPPEIPDEAAAANGANVEQVDNAAAGVSQVTTARPMGPAMGRITPTEANRPLLETVCVAAVIDDAVANNEQLWIKIRFTTFQGDDIAGGVIHGNLGTSQEEASGIHGIPIHIPATDVEYDSGNVMFVIDGANEQQAPAAAPAIDPAAIAKAVAIAMAAVQRAPADAVRLDPTPIDRPRQPTRSTHHPKRCLSATHPPTNVGKRLVQRARSTPTRRHTRPRPQANHHTLAAVH